MNIDINRKKGILFFIPNLDAGGAQKVATILLQKLNRQKFVLTLVLMSGDGKLIVDVPADVEIIDLECKHVRNAGWQVVRLIWKRKPEIVFSMHGNLTQMFTLTRKLLPKSTRLIARETNIVSYLNREAKFGLLYNLAYKYFYKGFDNIICQSEDMRQDLIALTNIEEHKLRVIHNPVSIKYVDKLMSEDKTCFPSNGINVLAAGKFMKQKGFDLLLQAFANVQEQYFQLTILGEGPEEANLRLEAKRLGISDRVTFAGFQINPYVFMRQADVFVLSSRFEGLPNVVLEANACGTPVVAFECLGGINEIIEDGINGWKVAREDTAALAKAIVEATKVKLSPAKIRKYVGRKFDVDKIISRYEEVLLSESM